MKIDLPMKPKIKVLERGLTFHIYVPPAWGVKNVAETLASQDFVSSHHVFGKDLVSIKISESCVARTEQLLDAINQILEHVSSVSEPLADWEELTGGISQKTDSANDKP